MRVSGSLQFVHITTCGGSAQSLECRLMLRLAFGTDLYGSVLQGSHINSKVLQGESGVHVRPPRESCGEDVQGLGFKT